MASFSKKNTAKIPTQAPPKIQKVAQEIIALYCLLGIYTKGRIQNSEMKKQSFDAYYGRGSGEVSAIDLFLAGDGLFSIFWEGDERELSHLLPGQLTDKAGVRYNVSQHDSVTSCIIIR